MKKRLISLLLAVIMTALPLAACSQSTDNAAENPGTPADNSATAAQSPEEGEAAEP